MVFLDMGGICCINYIGNYYTIMRCLKYFNPIILWTKLETLRIVVIHMKLVLFPLFFPAVMHSQTALVHNPTVSWRTFKVLSRLEKSLIPFSLINRVHTFLKYFSARDILGNVSVLYI